MNLIDLCHHNDLFRQALKPACNGRRADYERLEFVGDRVIGLVVAELLYQTFPNEQEGSLAKRYVSLTREETLADIALSLGLSDLIETQEHELRHNTSVLSDVCEAVMAALYLEQGLGAVREFMTPIWMPLIHADKQAPQDAKSALQEWAQKKYKTLPIYEVTDRAGPDHQPIFVITVTVGKQTAAGQGTSKKAAEQNAARNLLEAIHGKH